MSKRKGNGNGDYIEVTEKVERLKPLTQNHNNYLKGIETNILTLCIGLAGTAKTFLAVESAVKMFRTNRVKRLVFTRPAVECGERLGFLPGSPKDKIDPYIKPVYSILREFMPTQEILTLEKEGVIEICPLAHMRGSTYHNSFIVLDEGQNATYHQLKMAITRIGENTRFVINGDITQSDLYNEVKNSLLILIQRLRGVENVKIVELGANDILRSHFIQSILMRLSEYE